MISVNQFTAVATAFMLTGSFLVPVCDSCPEWQVIMLEVTAYSEECGMYPFDKTADGTSIRRGIVAAPPEVPFGTPVFVPGYGLGLVHDRGAAIQGRTLDIYMETKAEALQWGRRTIPVWIPSGIEWGKDDGTE